MSDHARLAEADFALADADQRPRDPRGVGLLAHIVKVVQQSDVNGAYAPARASLSLLIRGRSVRVAIMAVTSVLGGFTEALFLVVGLAGASTIGTQIVTYAYAGQFYPMAVRSTGIGFASGVGRSGAILAPIVIGALVAMALPLEQNFFAIAIPAVIAAVAVAMINHSRSASVQREDMSADIPDPVPARAGMARK